MTQRRGVVLLEVMIAVAVLALGAVSMVALASESLDAVTRAQAADADIARASSLLDAVALWPRADLDRHLGDRPEGAWRLQVERPMPMLYTVKLSDTLGGHVLLASALFRPEDPHAAP